jgi:uncharacterized domain HDIG
MDRVNSILFHPKYQQYYQEIQSLEADRKFCGHTMEHFLAVARLSFIMVKEAGLHISKEVVYATALLHDIGRALEYTDGTPHHEGSVMIARELLPECGFDDGEIKVIVRAIEEHRVALEEGHQGILEKDDFAVIFHKADKLSRNCFDCSAVDECNWPEERKNQRITL